LFFISLIVFNCSRTDDTDLLEVATYYNKPGTDRTKQFKLIAQSAMPYVDREEFLNTEIDKEPISQEITLVKTEKVGNQSFGTVQISTTSISEDEKDTCTSIRTQTWISEEGHWRRLIPLKLKNLASEHYDNGDYASAIEVTEEWLDIDPFSIEAYHKLYFSIMRVGWLLRRRSDRSMDDIIRSILAINESDHTALHAAITSTNDVAAGKEFLKRLGKEACYYESSVFNLTLNINQDEERLKFIKEIDTDDNLIIIMKIVALGNLNRTTELITSYETKRDEFVDELDDNDPSFAATWAFRLGQSLLRVGLYEEAQFWASYGISKDPTQEELSWLSKRIQHEDYRSISLLFRTTSLKSTTWDGLPTLRVEYLIENTSKVNFSKIQLEIEAIGKSGSSLSAKEATIYRTLKPRHKEGGYLYLEGVRWSELDHINAKIISAKINLDDKTTIDLDPIDIELAIHN
jgi:tetratricopeptide (TPR) repeat protein